MPNYVGRDRIRESTRVTFTHVERAMFPETGHAKGDVQCHLL
jgi:hypothetical protein